MPVKKFGEVYSRKDSSFLWIWYYDANRRRIQESTQTQDKALARKILLSRITEFEGLRSGVKAISDMPYSAFSEMYIKHCKARLAPESVKSYKTTTNEFQRFLGKEGLSRLSDIDNALIERFITYRRNERVDEKTGKTMMPNKANTCNNYLKNLHRQFEFAIDQNLMKANPLPPKYKKVPVTDATEKKALSKEEYQQVMKRIKKLCPFYYPIFYVYFHTGLRFTELIKQKWDGVLWDYNIMRVTKPKGKKRIETDDITLHPGVIKVLKSLLKRKTSDYIFTDEDGNPFSHRTRKFIRRLQGVAVELGIEDVVLHTTRHTYCSQLFAAGLTLPEVQAQMRHTEMRTTQKYAHMFRPQMNKKVARLQRLDR